jgi:hypothetical protein
MSIDSFHYFHYAEVTTTADDVQMRGRSCNKEDRESGGEHRNICKFINIFPAFCVCDV